MWKGAIGRRIAALTVLFAAAGAPLAAQDAAYVFEWQGSGGYSMKGALSFDAELAAEGIVTARDVQCFVVEGFRDGAPIGRWALGMLNEETTWILTFRPDVPDFPVYGPGQPMPQAWNMDGFGTDCGDGGFGFNIGNAAQDLCLDGKLLNDSRVFPSRPMPATPAPDSYRFPGDACTGPVLMGALEPRYR
ncbi:hypothetical protein [Salipiger sp.]|uniref:hypothetical protein n=1 Tax=Salipiger sp. TaxID=2078585 RepID=UPI003A987737